MKANNSPWTILGVDPGATQKEITQAFRRLAMDHHPDKGGNGATFAQVNQAYKDLKSKKFVPVLTQPDIMLLNVLLTIEQQIKGVNDIIVARKPGTDKEINLYVEIPPGAMAGDKFKVKYEGKHYILIIKEKSDPVFTRDGFSVIMNYTLDIVTALRGGKITITTPCGEIQDLEINAGTSQDLLVVNEKGLYNRKTRKRGNLYVHIITEIPAINDDNLELFVQQLKA